MHTSYFYKSENFSTTCIHQKNIIMFPDVSPARDASRNTKMDAYNLIDTLKRSGVLRRSF